MQQVQQKTTNEWCNSNIKVPTHTPLNISVELRLKIWSLNKSTKCRTLIRLTNKTKQLTQKNDIYKML